jgi:hypothetical protein
MLCCDTVESCTRRNMILPSPWPYRFRNWLSCTGRLQEWVEANGKNGNKTRNILTLKMETNFPLETSILDCETTRYHNLEGYNLEKRNIENLSVLCSRVKNWALKFGVDLWEFGRQFTKMSEIQKVSNTALTRHRVAFQLCIRSGNSEKLCLIG